MNTIVDGIISLFGGITGTLIGKQITVFIISLLPILELRGGLLAASLLGLDPISSYIICVIGNILPIPLILWFLDKVFDFMKRFKTTKKIVDWLEKKANSKKEQIQKYGYFGLLLFVGIPLPGTGAWTGCLIATVLQMDKKKAFVYALLGVIMASIIMMLISFGLLKMFI